MEPRYNEVLGTMKITLLYQVSHYIRVKKQRTIKGWDQQNYLVIRGFCYIWPLYNKVPLYYSNFLHCSKYFIRNYRRKIQPMVNTGNVTQDPELCMHMNVQQLMCNILLFQQHCLTWKNKQHGNKQWQQLCSTGSNMQGWWWETKA